MAPPGSSCTRPGAKSFAPPGVVCPQGSVRFAFQTQVTQTALANGRSKIEERLARWLLMADDRIDGDELPLTHEFLSLMLGVQRSGVTLAVQALEADRLIAARRGRISIRDRAKLEKKSNGTYTPQR